MMFPLNLDEILADPLCQQVADQLLC